MSQAVLTSDRRSHIRRTIFVVDILLLLAPPVHWLFSDGQSTIWYFLVANALVTLSLLGLWMMRDADEEETA
ncbi:hypothetical protein AB4Y77_08570 [Paenarthrobacter sp. YAF11_1]|uniref:hypothetical protein n=1 Tax=Micrococcaceae TaxID=1268 RepID=UPI0028832639|nr:MULTISPECIES: hypothetical protein [unclassified Arthrobacter]